MLHTKQVLGRSAMGMGVLAVGVVLLWASPLWGQVAQKPTRYSSGTLGTTGNTLSSLNIPLASRGYGAHGLMSSSAHRGPLYTSPLAAGFRRNPLLTNMRHSLAVPTKGLYAGSSLGRPLSGPRSLARPSRRMGLPTMRSNLSSPGVRAIGQRSLVGSIGNTGARAGRRAPSWAGGAGGGAGTLSTAGDPAYRTWGTDWNNLAATATPVVHPAAAAPPQKPVLTEADRGLMAKERKLAGNRHIVLAGKAFAKSNYSGSMLRLQIAQSSHPTSRLVRHLLVRSLVATGSYPQAAYHVHLLLGAGAPVVDAASLYAEASYVSPAERTRQDRQLAAFAASPRGDDSVRLLHAYWLRVTGKHKAAAAALDLVKGEAHQTAVQRLRALLRRRPAKELDPAR